MHSPEPVDPMQLRISDADRHKVADFLRDAAGEGRLELDELDERLEAVFRAKVYVDLVPLLADLPGEAPLPPLPATRPAPGRPAPMPPQVPVGDLPAPSTSFAVMSGSVRRGQWAVGPSYGGFALMGGIDLDLREAVFTTPETVFTLNVVMGGADIVVNPWTRVVVDGIGIMGAFEGVRDRVPAEITAASPLVRVRGVALMGAVTVTRKAMPGQRRKRLGRAPS